MLRDLLPDAAWDDVVIDTPPSLWFLTRAALAAADVVVAPVTCEAEAYEQLDRLRLYIAAKVTPLRPGQEIHAVIPTRYDSRRILDREVLAMLQARYPGKVQQPIREGVVARDAYVDRKPVSASAPESGVA